MSCGNFHCHLLSYLAGHRRGLQECCRPSPLRNDCRCRETDANLAAGVEGCVKVVGIVIHIPTHLKLMNFLTLISLSLNSTVTGAPTSFGCWEPFYGKSQIHKNSQKKTVKLKGVWKNLTFQNLLGHTVVHFQ